MSPEYREIPIDNIRLSPFNTRGEVSEEELQSLAETLKQSRGNDVPLKVRPLPNAQGIGELYEYEVVYGERRLKALKLAGIPTARCIVEDMNDTEVLMQQWMENEEHKDLSDYSKALKLKQIMDANQINQVQLAEKVGKTPAWISYHLSILKLKDKLTRVNLHLLSEKQARAILSASSEQLPEIIDYVEKYYKYNGKLPSTIQIEERIDSPEEDQISNCDICKHYDSRDGTCDLDEGECRFEEATPETGPAQLPVQGRPLSEPGQQEKQPPDHEHVYDAGSTHCRICGRELTAPESVKAGIGPICAGGKPRASPEQIYASIHDLYTRFENPNPIFIVRLLQQKHGLGHEGAYQALSDYKKNRQAQLLSPASTTEPTPETKEALEPSLDEQLEKTHSKLDSTTTCPICGQLDTQQHINEAISDFAEYLATAGILPPKGAELVKEALTRIRYGQDLKLIAEKKAALEPEEAEGTDAQPEEDEEEQESLADSSEAQAQEEDEDREREERETEEEQSHESTGPEEEGQ